MSRPPDMNRPEAPTQARAAEHFERLRPRLHSVAYSLLGTLPEAEDVVQDAWIRLQRTNLDDIDDLTGWLVTTTARLALDVLRSARHRRETYIGPWLPEPVETAPDPADTVGLADTLSWAMLVVLETLTPAERAAFVLHDVFGLTFDDIARTLGRTPAACRKLASRARDHVHARTPRFDVDPHQHRDLVDAFAQATGTGDLQRLLDLLAPDAVLTSDGGGRVSAARNPIHGADKVARFLIGVNAKHPRNHRRVIRVNGGLALLTTEDGRIANVTALGIADGRITTVDMVRNPDKFHGLHTARP